MILDVTMLIDLSGYVLDVTTTYTLGDDKIIENIVRIT